MAKKTSADPGTQSLISAPIAGCVMTGVGDPTGNTAAIQYDAIVTPLSSAAAAVKILKVEPGS